MKKAMRSGSALRRHPLLLVGVLAIALVVTPILSATAQEEPFELRIFNTILKLEAPDLLALMDLVGFLGEDEGARALFLEAPRDFLAMQEFVPPIELAMDEFQVRAIDFTLPPVAEEEPWYGVAEPLDDFVFEPKGVGLFYGNVAIFIQEAHEPLEGTGIRQLPAQELISDLANFVSTALNEALEPLRIVMRELEDLAPEDAQRAEFLSNPRDYLLGKGLTLPASDYRIVAIDLSRAEAAGSVIADEIRAGLGVYPEGIGVFSEFVGVFLQLAI